ncbi:histidine kinase [Microbacterium sp. SORGH_AS_0888]|uniref:histidine kinase n=1 Tax=Microbacterium sp. SORGH_AS_0888 TaxID=3041791 RepID=UPI00277E30A7|nr:histidine kinase [Microbacterium sp. SORGH_AS_0888]MDQ1127942.1 hypothetical protein [Microbacterium sp. SORGH_AS_0888]
MKTGLVEWLAGILLLIEGAAIVALALWQGAALAGGDTDSPTSAVALLVLTLVGAAAVIAFGVATLRDRSWGRSGGIVTQVLVLAVAGGAATDAYAHPILGLGIAAPAVVTLVLLVVAVVRAGRRRPR